MEEGKVARYDATFLMHKLAEERRAVEEHQEALKHWIGVAEAEGLPKTAISEASGISRVTINRWVSAGQVSVNVRDAIDSALEVMATHASAPGRAEEAARRIGRWTDIRMPLALLSNGIGPADRKNMSDEEKTILERGIYVGVKAQELAKEGHLPTSVAYSYIPPMA